MTPAKEVADILNAHYDEKKFHPLLTIWGVAYHWDAAREDLSNRPVENGFGPLIPSLFAKLRAQGERLAKPRIYVPKARDATAHYSLLCMRNHDAIARQFVEAAGAPYLHDLVSDGRLLAEASSDYLRFAGSRAAQDFIDFLSLPDPLFPEARGPYEPLLERLLVRFEQADDIFAQLEGLLEPSAFARVAATHYLAVEAKRPTVSASLLDALARHELPAPARNGEPVISPRRVFGKRRVRVGYGSNGSYMDLQALAERIRGRGAPRLDPEALCRQRLENAILSNTLPAFQREPASALGDLERRAAAATNAEEARALHRVGDLLKAASGFADSPLINHTMISTLRGEHHE